MHSSIDVANRLLALAQERKNTLTPMQLMKLVFLCHGWMLGIHQRHLIKDPIEAWLYGPVIKALYDAVKEHKSNPVIYPLKEAKPVQFCEEEEDIIRQVYEQYGHLSGIELSSLTHSEGSPWHKVWSLDGRNGIISNDLIEDYYKRQLDNAENAK